MSGAPDNRPPLRISSEEDGRILRLVLNRPRANVLDLEMIGAIRTAFRELAARHASGSRGTKLLVFEGEGSHFSFGASVEEHRLEVVHRMLPAFHALFHELEALEVPTAALVRGQCLGGGMELAIAAGRVICDPTARFSLPEVKLGVFPPVATFLLERRVGGTRATEIMLTGATVEGERAAAWGLADACVEDPEAELLRWYREELAPKSAVALRFAWRAARFPLRRTLERDLPTLERIYVEQLMSYHDPVEGIRAFLEKRQPEWLDR